jgi:hypothetical protein
MRASNETQQKIILAALFIGLCGWMCWTLVRETKTQAVTDGPGVDFDVIYINGVGYSTVYPTEESFYKAHPMMEPGHWGNPPKDANEIIARLQKELDTCKGKSNG